MVCRAGGGRSMSAQTPTLSGLLLSYLGGTTYLFTRPGTTVVDDATTALYSALVLLYPELSVLARRLVEGTRSGPEGQLRKATVHTVTFDITTLNASAVRCSKHD